VRAEVSKRSHLAVWESIVYLKKNKQGHCIEDTAGFAGGGDASRQAGGKARSKGAYRLPRGRLAKNHSIKGLGKNKR
jgi:hypothetical protein